MKRKKFVVKPVVFSTLNDSQRDDLYYELWDVLNKLEEAEDVDVKPFVVTPFELKDVEVKNGRITKEWYKSNVTNVARAMGFNLIILHITNKEAEALGLKKTLRGLYFRDNDKYMEIYIHCDLNEKPPRNRTRFISINAPFDTDISAFQWLVLHESAHAFTHFSQRREELAMKYGLEDGNLITHYFDYTLKSVGEVFREISFKKWSMMTFIIALGNQLIDLLLLQTLRQKEEEVVKPIPYVHIEYDGPDEPEEKPKESLVTKWAKAIEKFEDYVKPGEKYRDGKVAQNGSLSYRNNNPGNLRWSPYEKGNRGGFSFFENYDTGMKALIHQLTISVEGRSNVYKPEMTLLEFFQTYAPSSDNNHPATYAKFVADQVGVSVDTIIKDLA